MALVHSSSPSRCANTDECWKPFWFSIRAVGSSGGVWLLLGGAVVEEPGGTGGLMFCGDRRWLLGFFSILGFIVISSVPCLD